MNTTSASLWKEWKQICLIPGMGCSVRVWISEELRLHPHPPTSWLELIIRIEILCSKLGMLRDAPSISLIKKWMMLKQVIPTERQMAEIMLCVLYFSRLRIAVLR